MRELTWKFDKTSYRPGDKGTVNFWLDNAGPTYLGASNLGLQFEHQVPSDEWWSCLRSARIPPRRPGFASKLEAEKIRERTMRGKKAKARMGRIPGGGFARLYGYDYIKVGHENGGRRVINENETKWVRQIYYWLVDEGMSTSAITYRLRALNVPSKYGGLWCRAAVINILKNPAYTGRTYAFTTIDGKPYSKDQQEWIEIPNVTPAIINMEVFDYLYYSMRDLKKEVFKVIYLNSRNQIIATVDLFEGTLESIPIRPREIIENVIKHSAAAVIFVHNYPSGGPTPSKSDTRFTRDLVFMGNIIEVKVLDHIIIGNNRYFSFADEGLIKKYEDSFLNLRIRGVFDSGVGHR